MCCIIFKIHINLGKIYFKNADKVDHILVFHIIRKFTNRKLTASKLILSLCIWLEHSRSTYFNSEGKSHFLMQKLKFSAMNLTIISLFSSISSIILVGISSC